LHFIFARFCKFQKLFDKIKAKELLKEGSKGADINEGTFLLNIDVLFAFNPRADGAKRRARVLIPPGYLHPGKLKH
jgi:hypothetical protein